MEEIKDLVVSDEDVYSLTEAELEAARKRIICYDVILSDEEARIFDRITRKHYKETLEYEKKHWK